MRVAEIKIQPKQHRGRWLWLLLLIPIIWFVVHRRSNSQPSTGVGTDTTTGTTAAARAPMAAGATAGGTLAAAGGAGAAGTAATPGATASANGDDAVTSFTNFVASGNASNDEDAQHQYTADGIRRLADALDARATSVTGTHSGTPAAATSTGQSGGSSSVTAQQTSAMRAMADSLTMTAVGSDRHADMARASFDAAVGAMKTLKVGNTSTLQSAAHAIDKKKDLLAQKGQITRFFETARDALQSQTSGTAR